MTLLFIQTTEGKWLKRVNTSSGRGIIRAKHLDSNRKFDIPHDQIVAKIYTKRSTRTPRNQYTSWVKD